MDAARSLFVKEACGRRDGVRVFRRNAALDTAPVNAQAPVVVDDSAQRTAPKPKAQVIGELAPKLQKPGTTPGRARITAEQTYADAEKRFGSNAQTVLEMFQPGQDPRRFLDGFQNAYILGKQGAGPNALNNSTAAAYLTESQRTAAFEIGRAEGAERQIPMPSSIVTDAKILSNKKDIWGEKSRKDQHMSNVEMFQKAGDKRQSFRPISQKRFYDLTIEVRKKVLSL